MSSRSAYRVLSATWTPYVEHSFLYTPRIGDAEHSSVPKECASSLLRLLAGDLGLTAAGRALKIAVSFWAGWIKKNSAV